MEKTKQKSVKDVFPFVPVAQLGVVIVLAGISFFAGTLWTKTKSGTNVLGEKAAGTNGAAVQPTQPTAANPTAPTAPAGKALSAIAGEIGVDVASFKACLSSGEMATTVANQQKTGTDAGVTGTPGNVLLDRQSNVAYLVPGAYPYADVKKAIDDMKTGAVPQLGGQAAEKVTGLAPVTDQDHLIGNKDARFVLVEYSDFECPFCKRFHDTAVKLYKENSDVAWVYRHFPLEFHATAQKSAEASECLAKLGGNDAFWKFNEALAKVDAVTLD